MKEVYRKGQWWCLEGRELKKKWKGNLVALSDMQVEISDAGKGNVVGEIAEVMQKYGEKED